MSLCIDLVLNHTAREHPWAQGWVAGDPEYADFYYAFPDRTMPDRYERDDQRGLPGAGARARSAGCPRRAGAPAAGCGRRSSVTSGTSTTPTPRVFTAVLDTCLAGQQGRGHLPDGRRTVHVEAAGYQLHEPARGAPAAAAAARADQAGRARRRLQGRGDRRARRPGALPRRARAVPAGVRAGLPQPTDGDAVAAWPPRTPGWPPSRCAGCARSRRRRRGSPTCAATTTSAGRSATSTRAPSAATASAPGLPQRLLLRRVPASFARGALFQENPATGDARISGSAASLCGIEDALARGDPAALEPGIRRLVLLYSVTYACGGVPLLYMGDELALRNDDRLPGRSRRCRRTTAGCTGPASTRPPRPAGTTRRRCAGRVFGWLRRLGAARRQLPALRRRRPRPR